VFIHVIVVVEVVKNKMDIDKQKERVIRENLSIGTFICIEEDFDEI